MERKLRYLVLGATGGIGAAVCRELNRRGSHLAIAARDHERLDALAKDLGGATVRSLNATSFDEVEEFFRSAASELGQVDGAVNCVGSMVLKAADATSEKEWRG
jgi:NADP-dependent 3-hydroxy acid dehydrogenase YdfG